MMSASEDKKINTDICNNIREARLKTNLTQADVAKKAGIGRNSYAKIERAEVRPYGVTLVKIIKALGVKASDILPN